MFWRFHGGFLRVRPGPGVADPHGRVLRAGLFDIVKGEGRTPGRVLCETRKGETLCEARRCRVRDLNSRPTVY